MKKIDLAGLALAILMCSTVPATLQAQQEEPAAASPEGSPETPPAAAYEDVLFVEESLPYVPDSSTIGAKLPVPLLKTPASVGVVTGWLLEEQGGSALGEALKNVSGVNVQTQSGVADFFVVRGFDSIANGLVMVDGASEPEISFYQLYNVERVEVLKGPGGFLYGGSPIAATINMVRQQPEPGGFLSLGVEGGSHNTRGVDLDWNTGSSDAFGFRLNGLWRESDGWRDRPSDVRAVNPGFTWRSNEKSSLHANLELLDTSYAPDSGLPILSGFFTADGNAQVANVSHNRSYQAPYDLSDQETRRAQVDYEAQLSANVSLRDKAYYRRLDWDSAATIFNGVFPDPAFFGRDFLISRSLILLDDQQEFTGNQLEAVIAAKTGGVTHQILAGVEVARLADQFTLDVGFLPDINLGNPLETAQGPIFLIPGQSQAGDATSLVISPYVTDQIALSERFQVLAGARFDSIDYEDDATATERSFSQVSPLLGLVFSPTPSLSLYANSGRGFAPPSTRVVGKREPEESEQTKAGIKANLWGGKAQTTLAVYELERKNVAIPDRTGITRQTGTQRSRGVELEIAAEPLPRLRTFFSYAYTDAELTEFAELVFLGNTPPFFAVVDRSGNVPSFAPEHIANLWVSRRFGNGLGAGVGGRYLSKQFIAEDNAFELDDTTTLDAALFYDEKDWSLALHFDNLTDEEYFTRGFGSTSVIPAPGTTVHGSISYRFGLR